MEILYAALLLASSLAADPAAPPRLLIDGEFDDWAPVDVLHNDPAGDAAAGRPDLRRLSSSWDDTRLYLRLELGVEIGLQDGNDLTLSVDGGGGGKLEWHFGERRGKVRRGAETLDVTHGRIGLVTAPTTTSAAFEIVLDRHAKIAGRRLLPERLVKIRVTDGRRGDRLPDLGWAVFEIGRALPPDVEPLGLEKRHPSHLRILSYNTNDHLFEPHRRDAYRRILRAVDPDLVLLQEVRSNTSVEVLTRLAPALGEAPFNAEWHHARIGGEASVLLSPWPIEAAWPLGESAAFLLDSTRHWKTKTLLVALSAPCCNKDPERREEFDRIMAFVRNAKTPGGTIDVEPGTPLLLIGDANLVGFSRQRRTLLEGAIADEARHGPSFAPDWDESPFTDLVPRHTHGPFTFTWVGEKFPPGRLDYAIYSDSVIRAVHGFVLFTPGMPEVELERHGLEPGDTNTATDHLPLVVDFALPER